MSGIQGVGNYASQPVINDPQVTATPQAGQTAGVHHGHRHHAGFNSSTFKSALQQVTGSADTANSVEQQIQSAVQQALQSGGSPDAVKSAVDGVLQKNGIDPQALESALSQAREANAGHDNDAAAQGTAPPAATSPQAWTGASPTWSLALPRFDSQA